MESKRAQIESIHKETIRKPKHTSDQLDSQNPLGRRLLPFPGGQLLAFDRGGPRNVDGV